MREFEKVYTKRGNSPLMVIGVIIILFSFFSLIPAILIMFNIRGEEEKPPEEEKGKEGEKETV